MVTLLLPTRLPSRRTDTSSESIEDLWLLCPRVHYLAPLESDPLRTRPLAPFPGAYFNLGKNRRKVVGVVGHGMHRTPEPEMRSRPVAIRE
ncbi:hypothetical protein Y032_0126g1330 [Ancylostoma ceylanicum]|uniref:Uncharacterized protein n=1 Tax=Ancylostoma ceylanicum TaxID=53326 RepID=A0A016T8H7_9BILA|nr:hypothetical protein Y032_0126g1330 [Ancylostoma ceylanicum]